MLRRRFDSLKYDIKKIEEGAFPCGASESAKILTCTARAVVYDVSLRKLNKSSQLSST